VARQYLLHCLPPRAKLAAYYATFRERFGPQRLTNLDGEELLTTMHAHGNRDSMVYWLEFKNDDEFPTASFGSIAGGSAFKFGIFQRKETGEWVTGSSQIAACSPFYTNARLTGRPCAIRS
jgi:5-methylcytosine-specific restriction protein B